MNYNCEICNINFTTKRRLITHNESEKHKTVLNLHDSLKIKYDNDKKIIENKFNELKQELENKNKELLEKDKEIEDRDKQIKLLQDKSEEYRKIVEKAATKTTVNNNNNYTHNNYLNYISAEPLKFKEVKEQAKKYINSVSVMYDDEDFHDHIVDNILKDKSGKDKVLCTDINRKNFTYKDETSGKMIFDPELEKLRDQLKKGTDVKKIRATLLEKLVNEYEENGCIGIDPYKKFSDIIQKLNFGNPFIDHVAKKTYVKTKNTNLQTIKNKDNEINNENKNNKNNNDYEYDESSGRIFDEEEEYKKLLEEFGNEI